MLNSERYLLRRCCATSDWRSKSMCFSKTILRVTVFLCESAPCTAKDMLHLLTVIFRTPLTTDFEVSEALFQATVRVVVVSDFEWKTVSVNQSRHKAQSHHLQAKTMQILNAVDVVLNLRPSAETLYMFEVEHTILNLFAQII